MSPKRSRSRSVERRPERRRSASPRRKEEERRPGRKDRGFKWKSRHGDNDIDRSARDNPRLERGYRGHYKEDNWRRNRESTWSTKDDGWQRGEVNGSSEASTEPKVRDVFGDTPQQKEKVNKKVVGPVEPTIIVHVNDRLGTKAAIPCLASDPIRLFKALVAAQIGREPHEILLKRQGERPFKDQLTLEDYGVSNGVQLDLEVDTGA